jgi:hypothetical protein
MSFRPGEASGEIMAGSEKSEYRESEKTFQVVNKLQLCQPGRSLDFS